MLHYFAVVLARLQIILLARADRPGIAFPRSGVKKN